MDLVNGRFVVNFSMTCILLDLRGGMNDFNETGTVFSTETDAAAGEHRSESQLSRGHSATAASERTHLCLVAVKPHQTAQLTAHETWQHQESRLEWQPTGEPAGLVRACMCACVHVGVSGVLMMNKR